MADPAAPHDHPQGPLSISELHQLDATLLPTLERHHLRLLAHALRTLQQVQRIQQPPGTPELPRQAAIERWLLAQPSLSQEPDFSRQLAQQLCHAGRQLEELALQQGVPPLELELETLIDWAQRQADRRLTAAPADQAPAPVLRSSIHPEPPSGHADR